VRKALAAACLLGLAVPAQAASLAEILAAEARSLGANGFAFTRTIDVDGAETSGKRERRVVVERYDPSKAPALRWTLLSIDGRAPTAEEVKEAGKRTRQSPVPGYWRIADWVAAPTRTEVNGGTATLHFEQLPKGALKGGPVDLSEDMIGIAHVTGVGSRPWVERVRFALKRPVRKMLVARIDRLEIENRYRLSDDGRPILVEQVTNMAGVMLGKSGSNRTVVRFSDFSAR
jgi:hypothetical protein